MQLECRGVLIDLDGTVYDREAVIPGAADAVSAMRDAGFAIRFLTNTSRTSRADLVRRLAGLGIEVVKDEVYTASYGAALWLAGRKTRRAAVLVPSTALEDFVGVSVDAENPEAVLIGDLGEEWTFRRLNEAFRWLMSGAELVAIHKNPYWRTEDGLTLDAGAFVAALEYGSGRTAKIIGKPSKEFFTAAASAMGLTTGDVVMVGDDLTTDVVGAKAVGAKAILVRTGKFREPDLATARTKPDLILDSIAELPGVLCLHS